MCWIIGYVYLHMCVDGVLENYSYKIYKSNFRVNQNTLEYTYKEFKIIINNFFASYQTLLAWQFQKLLDIFSYYAFCMCSGTTTTFRTTTTRKSKTEYETNVKKRYRIRIQEPLQSGTIQKLAWMYNVKDK